MANGWIRCSSFNCHLRLIDTPSDRIRSAAVVNQYRRRIYNTEASTWLAQANAIFNRLKITRGFEDFGISAVPGGSNCVDNFPSIDTWYRLPSSASWANR
jgi:hypothetical protein